jgi:hypothetical protein
MLKETISKTPHRRRTLRGLISQEYHAHQTDETKDYITLKFFVDGEAPTAVILRNATLTIAISHIREQLKREYENIIPLNLLNELITTKPVEDLDLYRNKTYGLRSPEIPEHQLPRSACDSEMSPSRMPLTKS